MHVFCDTVGCRLNQSESDSLAADFRAAGDEVVARLARAGLANRILPTRLAARLLLAAADVARREGVHESGYRVIINTGADSGQIVLHLHLHLIGGQHMRYPIG